VEQQNWVYLRARELPVLDMMIHIWKDMQGKLFKRLQAAESAATSLSTHATLVYRQNEDSARLYDAIPTAYTAGLVYLRQDPSKEFKVNLYNQQVDWSGCCSCGKFQNDRMPCPHALALIHQLRLAPLRFIAPFYFKTAWVATYQQELPPLLRSSVSHDKSIIPPAMKQKGGGRPQKKRREQGSQAVSSQAVGGTTEMAAATAEPIQAIATQSSVTAITTTLRKKRPKRNPWVYVVDVPRLQEAVNSRTRSGHL
jgi:hypothetical protein